MADQREAVEMAGVVVASCDRCELRDEREGWATICQAHAVQATLVGSKYLCPYRPSETSEQLARAVIALDKEVRRLRGGLSDALEMWNDCDRHGDYSEERAGLWPLVQPDQPAPSSPGASEASGEEVERVARRLYVSQWDGPIDAAEKAWSGSSLATKKNWRELAREAIRLGARVPR